jgi:hypothetical protein
VVPLLETLAVVTLVAPPVPVVDVVVPPPELVAIELDTPVVALGAAEVVVSMPELHAGAMDAAAAPTKRRIRNRRIPAPSFRLDESSRQA